jgi:hypothetical protein
MARQRLIVSAGAVMALAALMAAPRNARAQTGDPAIGARALLGVPAGPSGFSNLDAGAAHAGVTPAERGLLGASSGVHVTVEPSRERGRRSPGETALLGR